MSIAKEALLADLPPDWPEDLLPRIQDAVRRAGTKIVVLDDDPTGNQTVHDVAVLTEGSVPLLTTAFEDPTPVVYVLTNSRSMPAAQARALNRTLAANLQAARDATGRDFAIVSRSDSTLRGHYPDETDALAQALGDPFDATLIVPFFVEGGRITAHDVHYVTEGERLIPAAETEFARDATFGYRHSNLRAWVSEKHGGRLPPEAVASITLDDVRRGGPDAVTEKLLSLSRRAPLSGDTSHGAVCVVNAVSYRDLEVMVAGLLAAEAAGKRFLYRTAASFVRVRGGIAPQPLLTHADLVAAPAAAGGLIVAGSHVQKTTRQVAAAARLPRVRHVEVAVPALLDPARRDAEIARAIDLAERAVRAGDEALVTTSREVIAGTEALTSLEIGQRVSTALVAIVRGLSARPAWVIAKGGITSSDVATGALGIRRAEVLGQALPGVPVWRTGAESVWPDLVYVVFPGNVGDARALAQMIEILRGGM